jgi:hypothetical protein
MRRHTVFPSDMLRKDRSREVSNVKQKEKEKPKAESPKKQKKDKEIEELEAQKKKLEEERQELKLKMEEEKNEKVFETIKNYLKDQENNFTAHKNELISTITSLVNETKNDIFNNNVKAIDGLNNNFSNLVNQTNRLSSDFNVLSSNFRPAVGGMINESKLNFQNPQFPQKQEIEKPQIKIKREKEEGVGGRYYPASESVWEKIKLEYPELPEKLKSAAFVRGEEKFIKMKNNYILLNMVGISKIMSKLNI